MELDYQYLVQVLDVNYKYLVGSTTTMPDHAIVTDIARKRIEFYYKDSHILEFLIEHGGLTSKGDISPTLSHKDDSFPTLHKALVSYAARLMCIKYWLHLKTKAQFAVEKVA